MILTNEQKVEKIKDIFAPNGVEELTAIQLENLEKFVANFDKEKEKILIENPFWKNLWTQLKPFLVLIITDLLNKAKRLIK